MKTAYITGVSGGIGKAIALELLRSGFYVYGIGRSNSISHPQFTFLSLDLSNAASVSEFKFPDAGASSYLLINNAGVLGEVLPIGEHTAANFAHVMQVNTIAPQILTNQFIGQFLKKDVPVHVLNISSGAGKRAIDAWATYCASKAALDLFAETIKLEMELRGHTNFFIHSVAPGVVDTNMQTQIRAASPEKFKASQRFHDLKNSGELANPEAVAQKLMPLINTPGNYPLNILSLTDI